MIMEVNDDFSFEKKQQSDKNNVKWREREELMLKNQHPFK